MNINTTNSSNTFMASAKPVQKLFTAELTGDRKALVRMTFDKNHDVTALETIISDSKNKLVDGKGILQKRALSGQQIADFFEKFQNNAKDGVNFFKEFIKAMKA